MPNHLSESARANAPLRSAILKAITSMAHDIDEDRLILTRRLGDGNALSQLADALIAVARGVPPSPAVAWRSRLGGPKQPWGACSKEHHDWVLQDPAAWPEYEVQALSVAAPHAAGQPIDGTAECSAYGASPIPADCGTCQASHAFAASEAAPDAWRALAMLCDEGLLGTTKAPASAGARIALDVLAGCGIAAMDTSPTALQLVGHWDMHGIQPVHWAPGILRGTFPDGTPLYASSLTEAQRKDLLAAAITIAARKDPTCMLSADDEERILGLLSDLAGMALEAAQEAPHA